MKTYLDCIPCFFRQALAAARMSSADKTIQRRILNSVAFMIPGLALDVTPPEIAQQVYRIVYEIVYVVREKPIINDVTIDDAVRVGLDKVV